MCTHRPLRTPISYECGPVWELQQGPPPPQVSLERERANKMINQQQLKLSVCLLSPTFTRISNSLLKQDPSSQNRGRESDL